MPAPPPENGSTSPPPAPGGGPARGAGPVVPGAPERRNPWIWISLLLAIVGVGLLVWALSVKSDNDDAQAKLASTEQQLDSTQKELDSTKQQAQQAEAQPSATPDESGGKGGTVLAAGAFAAAKEVYQDLADQLGATEQDLADTEQELKDAHDKAEQAEKDAKAAEKQAQQAGNETDKAKAEANQAQAEADAAQSKATIAADCAKAYVSAFGTLFEGENVKDQAAAVRKQIKSISTECKSALADA